MFEKEQNSEELNKIMDATVDKQEVLVLYFSMNMLSKCPKFFKFTYLTSLLKKLLSKILILCMWYSSCKYYSRPFQLVSDPYDLK